MFIYDEYGDLKLKLDLTGLGKKGGCLTSVDRAGNALVRRGIKGEEYAAFGIYFSNQGKELWRYEYQGYTGGLKLSPDGKYCMITSHFMGHYTCFKTTEPGKLLPNPFKGFDSSKLYYGDFTNDGSIVAINHHGILMKINPIDGIVEKQIVLSAPDGEQLYPGGNEWNNTMFSNRNSTVFGLRMYRPSENYNLSRNNWILVFDENLDIKMFEEDSCRVTIFDSCIVMARSKAHEPGQGLNKNIRYFNEKKGRLLDPVPGTI